MITSAVAVAVPGAHRPARLAAWSAVTPERLRTALRALAPEDQAAWNLHAQGLRYDQMASQMGVSRDEAFVRLVSARRTLRSHLLGAG
jgi:DNA-directed RNA polymerase specialized sigma24 family protein